MRDLLLARRVTDLDLVLEGDAVPFARALSAKANAALTVHERFRTATLRFPDGGRLDLATARSEIYEMPGALPHVRAASIQEDLSRRDFTINAMALEIAPRLRARLLDPFGGRGDLERGRVRLLSERSPGDDPTRAFRAVRYATRLGFRIERRTAAWIRAAMRQGSFQRVSGDRLRRELELLFSEEGHAAIVAEMGNLGLSRVLHPRLSWGGPVQARIRRAEVAARRLSAGWLSALLAWSADLDEKEVVELAARLSLVGKAGRILLAWPATLADLRGVLRPGRSARSRRDLEPQISADERAAAAAVLPLSSRRRLLAREEAPVRLRIRGQDLVDAGVSPGPQMGAALARTLSARREGRISEEEELPFALNWIRQKP